MGTQKGYMTPLFKKDSSYTKKYIILFGVFIVAYFPWKVKNFP